MRFQRLGKALLFPHRAILAVLSLASGAFLALSMTRMAEDSPLAIASYVLSAYTLTVLLARTPRLYRAFRAFKVENKYARCWQSDPRLRMGVSLCFSLVWNALYGILELGLGLYHGSFWFLSLGVYSLSFALLRFLLAGHTRMHAVGEDPQRELFLYRTSGVILLVMSLALLLIVFFMLYFGRSFSHHMITAIAMAAYTFLAFGVSLINVIRRKQYNSPVFSASRATAFAAACVSMLTLTSTMLKTFGSGTVPPPAEKLLLGAVGFCASAVVILMAVYMTARGTRELKAIRKEVQNEQRKEG